MSTQSPLTWTEDGQPRSRLYGDVYFSAEDGLAESRAVFLQGCGLPGAWQGRGRFVVGELGFGSGLNILALMELWRRTTQPDARLHVFSIEAHPITGAEAAQALARWPELSDLVELLVARWPGRARGFHRIEIPEARTTIDLAVMDVEAALGAWTGKADAWFLDGFSPALNPAMWREEIMALVAQRSAPGARAATFTVAGAVRRGLAAAGFEVEKRPGFGRKRERLEARLPGHAPPPSPRTAAIIGAGVAGASLARAFRALGVEPILIDAEGAGAGASGNPAGLVTPRLDAGLGPIAELFAQSLRRAGALYEATPDVVIARGVLQLAQDDRDPARFAKIAASDLFEPGDLTPREASSDAPAALAMSRALVAQPTSILKAWTGQVLRARVVEVQASGSGWRLIGEEGETLLEAGVVVLAAGAGLGDFGLTPTVTPVRGQASWMANAPPPPAAMAWGGYIVPTRDGLLFGATHDRGQTSTEVRQDDHERNLATLAERLPATAASLAGEPLEGRASIRATTSDHLPLAGAIGGRAGLYVLGGLGSRGLCLAPLLAEHVAALALDAPSPLPEAVAAIVDPDRFRKRAERKGRNPA
ncbi:tRNA (5-methylaminomethyl-2-thiouridine)(34)-methyltransferase MnmD [Phenylobacterium koreense]|uniref:tRNA 5-methylaminomethyl-2-thiouridine biosynthesis bifunctional protein MnmC n=1 Tax=Phenylobacterium koreense TaxID=266125 RepID=A0ABV2EGK0_9CAUL